MLYTFLFSHKNSTCIRQVQGNTLEEAVDNWVSLLEGVSFGKDDSKVVLDLETVRNELKESRLVSLRNLHNVWCTFLRFGGVNALLNVVLMQGESEDNYALT